MAKYVVKNTNQEAVVKVWGQGNETISLQDDIVANTQEVNGEDFEVNILSVNWAGLPNSTINISRDGENIIPLTGSSPQNLDFAGQGYVDNSFNNSDIDVEINGADATAFIVLRKVKGYATKVETATYGIYDDEDAVGASTIPGAPTPDGLFDLPIPGSGEYQFDTEVDHTALSLVNWSADVSSISNGAPGLWRKKFQGTFGTAPGSGIDVNFCRDTPGYFGKVDMFAGFGNQGLDSENNYTLEWVGYFKAPSTDTYNFHISCDDDTYLWIGEASLEGENGDGNFALSASNQTYTKTTNSISMVEGRYYPVRIQFAEYSGSERMQLFWSNSNSASYGYSGASPLVDQVWFHDSVTKGH
jgi:hypothetical protein